MHIADGLEWMHVYWVNGHVPKNSERRNEVSDPPCNGWQHAFIMRGEKSSTILCPYTLSGYVVSNRSLEVAGAKEPKRVPSAHAG